MLAPLMAFLRLRFPLKLVALRTAAIAPRLKRKLGRLGYPAAAESTRRRYGQAFGSVAEAREIAAVAQSVTGKLPGEYNCLARSLVVWWLLGGDSAAKIVFGLKREQDSLAFHAWVEVDSEVVNDIANIAETYTPFGKPPPAGTSFD